MTVPLYHRVCMAPCTRLGDEEPPDPDMWGNLSVTFRCTACDERGTVTFPPYGQKIVPLGFAYEDDIEWTVPLP